LGSDSYEIRNSQLAAKLTSDAVELLHEDPTVAERLLREALLADLYHGPAHNNLGVLYLSRGELYQAAEEFDWARRLMPGHPDPRINLGIVLERGGKVHEALEAYASALEVYPDHLPAIQAIVRCQLRHDETDDRTHKFLRVVSFRGTREWKEWARGQLSSDVRQDQ
jgi:tetratricopeptide (TPR) repeat protein